MLFSINGQKLTRLREKQVETLLAWCDGRMLHAFNYTVHYFRYQSVNNGIFTVKLNKKLE